jgi:hypothetical protein
MPTIHEIVREYLEREGYDGLANPDLECGCFLDDLFPCGGDLCSVNECEAGHKVPNDQPEEYEGEWLVRPGKRETNAKS